MSDSPTTPVAPPRHLTIFLTSGAVLPVLRIDPDEVGWWWDLDAKTLHVGPVEGNNDPEFLDLWIPREQIAMVQESECRCDHAITETVENWLQDVIDGVIRRDDGE